MLFLGLILFVAWILNIRLGSVNIGFYEIFRALSGKPMSRDVWESILFDYRIPKSFTAIITGSGLAATGLLMQTLFKNPMAGPSVLGISSGAGLGVALLVMGNGILGHSSGVFSNISLSIAAISGAFVVLISILAISYRLKHNLSILIIGIMLGALSGSLISILAYFSHSSELQEYMFWSFGSLGHLSRTEVMMLSVIIVPALGSIVFLLKPLNILLLGENYAQNLGVNVRKTKFFILLISGIITGVITAFVGPIAFIGLAVPHIARLLFNTSNHKILFPASLLLGAVIMLVCDSIAQFPFQEKVLPINAVTSLFGAPLVIWLLLHNKKYNI